jgi:hypothetical protein
LPPDKRHVTIFAWSVIFETLFVSPFFSRVTAKLYRFHSGIYLAKRKDHCRT